MKSKLVIHILPKWQPHSFREKKLLKKSRAHFSEINSRLRANVARVLYLLKSKAIYFDNLCQSVEVVIHNQITFYHISDLDSYICILFIRRLYLLHLWNPFKIKLTKHLDKNV